VTTVIDVAVVVEQIGQGLVSVSVTSRLQGIGSKYRERTYCDSTATADNHRASHSGSFWFLIFLLITVLIIGIVIFLGIIGVLEALATLLFG
jgi:hypothetical protein